MWNNCRVAEAGRVEAAPLEVRPSSVRVSDPKHGPNAVGFLERLTGMHSPYYLPSDQAPLKPMLRTGFCWC